MNPPGAWRRLENQALITNRIFMHAVHFASTDDQDDGWEELSRRLADRGFHGRTASSCREQVESLLLSYEEQGDAAPFADRLAMLAALVQASAAVLVAPPAPAPPPPPAEAAGTEAVFVMPPVPPPAAAARDAVLVAPAPPPAAGATWIGRRARSVASSSLDQRRRARTAASSSSGLEPWIDDAIAPAPSLPLRRQQQQQRRPLRQPTSSIQLLHGKTDMPA